MALDERRHIITSPGRDLSPEQFTTIKKNMSQGLMTAPNAEK